MEMFRRVFLAAILAGLAAGIVWSAVQQLRVTPFILAAEVFENEANGHAHTSGEAVTDAQAWAPADGIERTAYTVLANVIVAMAFSLALAGASLLLDRPVTLANGAIWGFCGFLAFSLAPAAGLPPELPGIPGGDLWDRQIWWWFTAATTAAGLALLAARKGNAFWAVALVLIALPHVIGAPDVPEESSNIPAHLASGFVANALASAAIFWICLGLAQGFINERSAKAALTHDPA
jgi:cobalt transporter subunit CbtA